MSSDYFVTDVSGRSVGSTWRLERNSRSAYTIDNPPEHAVDCGPYKGVGHFDIDTANAFDNPRGYKT